MRPNARWINKIVDAITGLIEEIRDGFRARAPALVPIPARPRRRRPG